MSEVGMMLKHAWSMLFGADVPSEHANRLAEIDRIQQDQEERLERAQVAVLSDRFRRRFDIVTHNDQP